VATRDRFSSTSVDVAFLASSKSLARQAYQPQTTADAGGSSAGVSISRVSHCEHKLDDGPIWACFRSVARLLQQCTVASQLREPWVQQVALGRYLHAGCPGQIIAKLASHRAGAAMSISVLFGYTLILTTSWATDQSFMTTLRGTSRPNNARVLATC